MVSWIETFGSPEIAIPWHWGYRGSSTGDSANDLGSLSGDPNTTIQSSKAFSCNVRAGRREGATTEKLEDAPEGPHVEPDEDSPAEVPKG